VFSSMREFFAGSIRNKLLLTMAVLSIGPLVILGFVSLRSAEAALRQRALGQVEAVAQLQRDRIIDLYEGTYRTALESIATNEDIIARVRQLGQKEGNQEDLSAEIRSRLERTAKALPGFASAVICDAKGIVITDTLTRGRQQIGMNKADDAYFAGAMANQGKVFIKPLYKSTTGNFGTAVSVAMVDPRDRTYVGVAVIRLTNDEIVRTLSQGTTLGETGQAFLVNSEGSLTTQKASDLQNKATSVGIQKALEKQTGSAVYANHPGNTVLGYYTWIPDLGMGLVAEVNDSEAFAAVYRLRVIVFSVVAIAAILVAAAGYLLTRNLTNQVNQLMNTFGMVGIGDLKARAKVITSDELGTVATSLNGMLDNFTSLIQSREERDSIQASIGRLLDEVSGLAEGDLTKEAEVTSDVTGAIADSFNYMIEQLRKIIGSVQDVTLKVTSAATEIHSTAEHLAQGSEVQSKQIVNTSSAIGDMVVSIQKVSENAAVSSTVAQQALNSATQGSKSVQNTIDGMNRIRDQVQETAKRIKRLGESSQEIGQIIQLIDDIADRTSILALNASIQAAMAGEAGRGFAVVAEEVERLAVRSTDATKKIDSLVKTIQSETNEAVAAMEKNINEVVEGSKLANQAGQALEEIESVSNRLAELIQSISQASKQQARGSEALAKSMNEISNITQQTSLGNRQAAQAVSNLAGLADELRESVSAFRLPGRENFATVGSIPASSKDTLSTPSGPWAVVTANLGDTPRPFASRD
jgi:methyl-accepting chemotaxis protein